jgi:hypothetical protein
MDLNGYWRGNQWVPGATVKTGGTQGTSGLALEVAAACARCVEGRSEPLTEIKELLTAYPVLKLEAREPEDHLLAPLARLYAEWVLR